MPQIVWVLIGEDVLPAEPHVNARVERLGGGDELVPRVAGAAAGYYHRATRLVQAAGDPSDLFGRRCCRTIYTGPALRSGDVLAEQIRGEGQHDRPGTPGGGDPESPFDELRHTVGAVHRSRPLGDRCVEDREVHLLEGLPPEKRRLDLPQQDEHGRRILPRRVNADGQVGRANAPGGHRHRRHPGELGVGLGHERGAGFVPGRDERQLRVTLHGVHDLEEALAGDGIEAPDAGPRQHLDRGVAGFDLGASGHLFSYFPGVPAGQRSLSEQPLTSYTSSPRMTFDRSRISRAEPPPFERVAEVRPGAYSVPEILRAAERR
jgi:hypothetical protein